MPSDMRSVKSIVREMGLLELARLRVERDKLAQALDRLRGSAVSGRQLELPLDSGEEGYRQLALPSVD